MFKHRYPSQYCSCIPVLTNVEDVIGNLNCTMVQTLTRTNITSEWTFPSTASISLYTQNIHVSYTIYNRVKIIDMLQYYCSVTTPVYFIFYRCGRQCEWSVKTFYTILPGFCNSTRRPHKPKRISVIYRANVSYAIYIMDVIQLFLPGSGSKKVNALVRIYPKGVILNNIRNGRVA